MKVGDLVRHSMYSNRKPVAIILKLRRDEGCADHIKILDEGDIYWDRMAEYEVISESR